MERRKIERQIFFERCNRKRDHTAQFVAKRVWVHVGSLTNQQPPGTRGHVSDLKYPGVYPQSSVAPKIGDAAASLQTNGNVLCSVVPVQDCHYFTLSYRNSSDAKRVVFETCGYPCRRLQLAKHSKFLRADLREIVA